MAQTANPFPGLRPFRPEESALFFGRDEQIGEALDRLLGAAVAGGGGRLRDAPHLYMARA